jgi:hypothetical protein
VSIIFPFIQKFNFYQAEVKEQEEREEGKRKIKKKWKKRIYS